MKVQVEIFHVVVNTIETMEFFELHTGIGRRVESACTQGGPFGNASLSRQRQPLFLYASEILRRVHPTRHRKGGSPNMLRRFQPGFQIHRLQFQRKAHNSIPPERPTGMQNYRGQSHNCFIVATGPA